MLEGRLKKCLVYTNKRGTTPRFLRRICALDRKHSRTTENSAVMLYFHLCHRYPGFCICTCFVPLTASPNPVCGTRSSLSRCTCRLRTRGAACATRGRPCSGPSRRPPVGVCLRPARSLRRKSLWCRRCP